MDDPVIDMAEFFDEELDTEFTLVMDDEPVQSEASPESSWALAEKMVPLLSSYDVRTVKYDVVYGKWSISYDTGKRDPYKRGSAPTIKKSITKPTLRECLTELKELIGKDADKKIARLRKQAEDAQKKADDLARQAGEAQRLMSDLPF